MEPYRTLLVPLDPNGCAGLVVAHATRLAAALGAEVVLLTVVDLPVGAHTKERLASGETLGHHLDVEAEAALAGLRAQAEAAGVPVRVMVKHGVVVPQVLAAIADSRADLVIMGTHGRTGLRRLVLGSVADELIRTSPVPVTVIRGPDGTADQRSSGWFDAAVETEG